MKKIKQKKGISLIVLAITIIVMIILAAAIILSLDGSDIIERAKNAQVLNDEATLKEIIALAKSEWSFERPEGYDTFREYAESKLEEAGYDTEKIYVEESGEVLYNTAAEFAKAGVQIGTRVIGYKLNSTMSYTTSGKENTADSLEPSIEVSPQPATITRDMGITWTYIGADENGNALIAGSVTSTTPTITLGGRGGYLNGVEELDAICDVFYSTEKGTARSMKIEDVTRVLNYVGEEGAYYIADGTGDFEYIPTKKALTVREISNLLGMEINPSITLNDKDTNTYKSNYYMINKIEDASEYDALKADLVYPARVNTSLSNSYWLSSTAVRADFWDSCLSFGVRSISEMYIDFGYSFDTHGNNWQITNAIRPVVSLNSDLEVTYDGKYATLK